MGFPLLPFLKFKGLNILFLQKKDLFVRRENFIILFTVEEPEFLRLNFNILDRRTLPLILGKITFANSLLNTYFLSEVCAVPLSGQDYYK